MQKPTPGAQRRPASLRPGSAGPELRSQLRRRGTAALRALRSALARGRTAADAAARPLRGPRPGPERLLPISLAVVVAGAALFSATPAPGGASGGTDGAGAEARLALGGGDGLQFADAAGFAGDFQRVDLDDEMLAEDAALYAGLSADPFLEDGTLVTAFAPSTVVADGAALLRSYRVESGDTLVGIAKKHGVTMMTLWWANKLASKDDLKVGQVLVIPPVDGLVVTVTASDTLESLAAKYAVDPQEIVEVNQLDDPVLIVGQTLIVPGVLGEGIPTPKATPRTYRSSGGGTSSGITSRYTGGAFKWPVVGGNNYISQYYHYGHYGIDIAATYGSRVVAAAAGKVIFAGWKSNGGGYQVWISHGSNRYTTYNHMSGVSVGRGQYVSRGQQVGRIGSTGYATGPHLHFEVWVGMVWGGGNRVNPLRYF